MVSVCPMNISVTGMWIWVRQTESELASAASTLLLSPLITVSRILWAGHDGYSTDSSQKNTAFLPLLGFGVCVQKRSDSLVKHLHGWRWKRRAEHVGQSRSQVRNRWMNDETSGVKSGLEMCNVLNWNTQQCWELDGACTGAFVHNFTSSQLRPSPSISVDRVCQHDREREKERERERKKEREEEEEEEEEEEGRRNQTDLVKPHLC